MSANASRLAMRIINMMHQDPPFTDLQILPDKPILLRTPLGYTQHGGEPVSTAEMEEFLSQKTIGGDRWKDRMHRNGGVLEAAVSLSARIRVSAYETDGEKHSLRIAVRRLPLQIPPIKSLGLPPQVEQLANRGKGLVLITGPTGAGKTTTMASMLDHINATRAAHIITVEQPIEYEISPKRSVISQCEVPYNTPSFEAGVEGAMRHNPDVIAVAEVMNRSTLDAMLRAALSGHLVFATLHTNSCVDTVETIAQFFDGAEASRKRAAFAAVLAGIVSQALLPTKDGKSLILAWELLMNNTNEMTSAIRDGKVSSIKGAMMDGKTSGMRMLNDTLRDLLVQGKVTLEAARRASYDENGLKAV
ncbi:MAG: type IV pilus twitching motility protein PilT [Acidiferrobacterales bacterium]